MQRPMRRFGDIIRGTLACPLCGPDVGRMEAMNAPNGMLRIVAYRTNTVRLECRLCGLRFTVNRRDVLDTFDRLRSESPFPAALADVIWRRHETDG
ncbi:hypothetical protein BH23ACT10_BH23ACT10_10750 [soil metagenome]